MLGLREFVVAFFVMAAAASLPNLFVGITSATQGIPELSLGDVFGNNFVAVTLALSAGVLFAQCGFIRVDSHTVRGSILFTAAAALLPVLLISDGSLDRSDGIILIILFLAYMRWLFLKRDRFSKKYNHERVESQTVRVAHIIPNILKIAARVALLFVAALGIVFSATFFAEHLGVPLLLIGILVVGLGNALPEVYFSIISARRGDTELIMGNVMGSVIIPATLVLGIVALIHPIIITDPLSLGESRLFLIVAIALFLLFSVTHKRIGRFEALALIGLYGAFVLWSIGFSL